MKKIPLTQGRFALVDDEDFEYLSQWKWNLERGGRSQVLFYAKRKGRKGEVSAVKMHRVIMKAGADQQVDHIDHDGLNNQKSNMRLCTIKENCMNRRTLKKTASGLRGVTRTGKKWMAQIRINRKLKYLGTYSTKEEAAIVYDAAAIAVFGEFSILNFPERFKKGI